MAKLAPRSENDMLIAIREAVEGTVLITTQTKQSLDEISLIHALGGEDTSRRSRSGHSLLVVSATGTGKSTLIDVYCDNAAPELRYKMITVVPGQPAKSPQIIVDMLATLDDDEPLAGSTHEREERCFKLLKDREIELIFFDELHQFTSSGSKKDVNTRGGHWLKTFMDRSCCPLIGFATEEVFELLGHHHELASRFPNPIAYDPFCWDLKERRNDFFVFLRALEKSVDPLRAKGVLTDPRVAAEVHAETQGRARLVKHAVIGSATLAVRNGLPALTPEMVITAAKATGLKALRDGVLRKGGRKGKKTE